MRSLSEIMTKLPLPLKSVLITVMTLACSHLVVYGLMEVSFFSPMEKARDFRFSDFYTIEADDRAVADPDSSHQSYISLSKREKEGGYHDGAFHFVLHYSMRQPLYFNIISRNDDKEGLSLFFAQNPIASPKDDTVAEEYVFLPNADGRGYVAIASDVDFRLDDKKRLLEADYDPDDKYYLTILRGEYERWTNNQFRQKINNNQSNNRT